MFGADTEKATKRACLICKTAFGEPSPLVMEELVSEWSYIHKETRTHTLFSSHYIDNT